MGGNKQQAAQRRQAKAAIKAKERKAMGKKTPPPAANPLNTIQVDDASFPTEDMIFWVAHGINCITSDYDTGTWTPMFDEIYRGHLPTPEAITQAVMDRYNVPNKEWPHEAKAALAWAVQERHIVYVYYKEAVRRLTAAHGGDADIEGMARAPHNPLVWALFDYLKTKILNRKKV